MTKAVKIRKGDHVSIPVVLTGTVKAVTVATPQHGDVTLIVPESHDITINQITLRNE